MTYEQIVKQINYLSEDDKSHLCEYLEFVVTFGTEHQIESKILQFDHVETKCPKCGSYSISKNGHFRNKQRYICKACHASFNDFTNTFLYHNKIPIIKWIKFCRLFVEGKSLPYTSKELGVTVATAFYMRHKLLDAISITFDDILREVIEADETFLPVSYKGQNNLPRESRKRGSQTQKRGLSIEKVCIAVALDTNKNLLIKPICLGRVQIVGLHTIFDNHIKPGSILCTDRASAYMEIAVENHLKHHRYKDKNEFDEFHINHINAEHNNFKLWISKFRGVSTKYLENYTSWFKILHMLKHTNGMNKIRTILEKAIKAHVYKTHMEIKNTVPNFM